MLFNFPIKDYITLQFRGHVSKQTHNLTFQILVSSAHLPQDCDGPSRAATSAVGKRGMRKTHAAILSYAFSDQPNPKCVQTHTHTHWSIVIYFYDWQNLFLFCQRNDTFSNILCSTVNIISNSLCKTKETLHKVKQRWMIQLLLKLINGQQCAKHTKHLSLIQKAEWQVLHKPKSFSGDLANSFVLYLLQAKGGWIIGTEGNWKH